MPDGACGLSELETLILRATPKPIVLIAAATLAACGDSSTRLGMIDSGTTTRDGTATIEDARTDPRDADTDLDAGTLEDTGTTRDAGTVDTGTRDTGSPEDSGEPPADSGTPGNACTDLQACCSAAPAALQGLCNMVASSGNQGQCAQVIGVLQQFGVCMASPTDAGPPADAGPLGPNCTDYLACCPSLGAASALCISQANMGNEATCAMQLMAFQSLGQCGGDGGLPGFDGSLPDLGRRDTGVHPREAGPDSGEHDDADLDDADLDDADLEDAGIEDTGTSSTSTAADAG